MESKRQQRLKRFSKKSTYVGSISRNESTDLYDEQFRYQYFSYIIQSFITYCSINTSTELNKNFNKFLNQQEIQNTEIETNETISIDYILTCLRKLREVLIALPISSLHKKVFLFSIRISCVLGHYQTYLPSIKYVIASKLELSETELQEIIIVYILHLVLINKNWSEGFQLFYKYIPERTDVYSIMISYLNNNYYQWFSIFKNEENLYISSMMKLGITTMTLQVIKCFSKSYYNYPKSDFMNLIGESSTMDTFLKTNNVSWQVENDNIVIRSRKSNIKP